MLFVDGDHLMIEGLKITNVLLDKGAGCEAD